MTNWYRHEKNCLAEIMGFASYPAAVCHLYRAGMSCRQVAKKFNVKWQAVQYQLKKCGVILRSRGGRNHVKK